MRGGEGRCDRRAAPGLRHQQALHLREVQQMERYHQPSVRCTSAFPNQCLMRSSDDLDALGERRVARDLAMVVTIGSHQLGKHLRVTGSEIGTSALGGPLGNVRSSMTSAAEPRARWMHLQKAGQA